MKLGTDDLGDRMKRYEEASQYRLPIRMPIIIRVDGRSFHQLLKHADKPYSTQFREVMDTTTLNSIQDIQGAEIAYIQSDEISFLLTPYTTLDYSPWFDSEIQKLSSITASLVTREFNNLGLFHGACFDARAFVVPKEDVVNYFIWRQRDWERNSLQMLTRSLYSHKQAEDKNTKEMKEMTEEKGWNWDKLSPWMRRGGVVIKKTNTIAIPPRFEEDRGYIERFVYPEPEVVE